MIPTSTRAYLLSLLYPFFLDQLGPVFSKPSQTPTVPHSHLYDLHVVAYFPTFLYFITHLSGCTVLFYDLVAVTLLSSLGQVGNHELLDY